MTNFDEYGRPDTPPAGNETETLLGFLDFHRATLAWRCSGLNSEGLNTTVAASSMTLGGLLKHMALVEDGWFSESLFGNARHASWAGVDWVADPDWEWHSAADDTPEQLRVRWHEAVDRSRELTATALERGGLDQAAIEIDTYTGVAPSLRWIVVHMIEEYARHNGHADLIREAIDGVTGE